MSASPSAERGKKRQQRSNVNGQEEMVEALWDFAAEVVALGDDHSFGKLDTPVSDRQMTAIRNAMERISAGYGYRIVEIQ